MSGFGLCVRNGFGPAPAWTAGCHEYKLVQYVAPAQAEAPAAMPASAPAPVVVAAPLVWESVTFDANILFDSDSSALRTTAAGEEAGIAAGAASACAGHVLHGRDVLHELVIVAFRRPCGRRAEAVAHAEAEAAHEGRAVGTGDEGVLALKLRLRRRGEDAQRQSAGYGQSEWFLVEGVAHGDS